MSARDVSCIALRTLKFFKNNAKYFSVNTSSDSDHIVWEKLQCRCRNYTSFWGIVLVLHINSNYIKTTEQNVERLFFNFMLPRVNLFNQRFTKNSLEKWWCRRRQLNWQLAIFNLFFCRTITFAFKEIIKLQTLDTYSR